MQAYPKLHDTLGRLFNHLEHSDDEAGAAMAQEAINLLPRWIPVTERLPDSTCDCIVTDGTMRTYATWCASEGVWDAWLMESDYVTHWIPMLEPPKP